MLWLDGIVVLNCFTDVVFSENNSKEQILVAHNAENGSA